jgi:hypothetical protein
MAAAEDTAAVLAMAAPETIEAPKAATDLVMAQNFLNLTTEAKADEVITTVMADTVPMEALTAATTDTTAAAVAATRTAAVEIDARIAEDAHVVAESNSRLPSPSNFNQGPSQLSSSASPGRSSGARQQSQPSR